MSWGSIVGSSESTAYGIAKQTGIRNAAELGILESGRRDSNPRPSPWQGGAIGPTNSYKSAEVRLRPQNVHLFRSDSSL
jgi:hypothetical protein